MTGPDAPPVLRMAGISKSFGATRALDDVGFELRRGEVHALLGENGAGKSTMMKVLSGAVRPDRGEMRVEGERYAPDGPLDGRRRGIAMIYQELTLAPHLSVEENVTLGREPRRGPRLDRRARRERVREVLSLLNHPEIDPAAAVRSLSVGARQVVEIARALAARARILVMDEPTSSLSLEDTRRLFAIVRRLAAQGVGIVYISHFLEEVREVADAFTVLRDGHNVGSGRMAGATLEGLVSLMVGQEVSELFPRVEHEIGAPLLTARALKGRRMASPVDLELRRGEILGIAGLIGSGRTETLRALFGLDALEGGVVVVAGRAEAPPRPWARIRQGLGLLSEDRQGEGLALGMTIADNLTLSHYGPYRRRGLLRGRRHRAAVRGWLERLHVKSRGPGQKVGDLSGGNQQKIALGRLLHQSADALLLDEPTRGIDVVSKAQIYELIGELARAGKSVLFVSSYLPELLGVCDRIAVFHRGAVVDVRTRDRWDAASLLTAATVGRAGAGETPGAAVAAAEPMKA